ncbi:unnamed protein product [Closterium sp. NIES-54]
MGHSVFTTERDSLASVLLGLLPSNVRRSVSLQSSYPRSAAGIPRPPSAGSILPPPRVFRCNRIFRRLRSSLRFWLQSWPFSLTPVKSSLSLSRQASFDRRRTAGLLPSLLRFPRSPRFSCLRKPHPLLALLLLAAALVSLWDVEFVVEIGDDRTRAASSTIGGEQLRWRRESWGAEEILAQESLRHPTSWSSGLSQGSQNTPLLRSSLLYPSLRLDEGNRAAPMRGRLLGLAAQSLVAKQWQPEPPDLWEEPPEAMQWRPCALDHPALPPPAAASAALSARPAMRKGAAGDGTAAAGGSSGSSGSGDSGGSGRREDAGPFFSVAAKGGLSQLRVAVSCLPACQLLASPFIHTPTPSWMLDILPAAIYSSVPLMKEQASSLSLLPKTLPLTHSLSLSSSHSYPFCGSGSPLSSVSPSVSPPPRPSCPLLLHPSSPLPPDLPCTPCCPPLVRLACRSKHTPPPTPRLSDMHYTSSDVELKLNTTLLLPSPSPISHVPLPTPDRPCTISLHT